MSRLFSRRLLKLRKTRQLAGKDESRGKRGRKKKRREREERDLMDFDYRSPHCFSISDHFPARLCKRMVFIDSRNGFREIAIPILLLRVLVGITGITGWMEQHRLQGFSTILSRQSSSLRDIFNERYFSFLPFPLRSSRPGRNSLLTKLQ